jgi:hypothetical protein
MSGHLFSKRQVGIAAGVALCLILALLGTRLAASSNLELPEPTNEAPIWSIDLHTLGFARDQEPGFTFFGIPSHYSISTFDTHPLAFSSTNELAVAFVTHDVKGTKGEPIPGSWQLHFMAINSATGEVIAKKDSPMRSGYLPLMATYEGNFLLKDSYRLILYSTRLEKLSELDTEPFKPVDGFVTDSFSDDGRYIFVASNSRASQTVRMFDADSFQELRSQHAETGAWAASNSQFAVWQDHKELYRRSLYLRLGAESKEIYRDTGCGTPFYSAHFVTEDELVILSCNRLTLIDIEGKELFRQEFRANRPLEQRFGASSDGSRFAISLGESKGVENKFLDLGRYEISWRLFVYDNHLPAPITSFALNGKPFGFAFSPDGSELALLRGGILAVFRLPPASPTGEIGFNRALTSR